MGSCEVWDIVKVPFPYTNRPAQQYRPALVVAEYREAGAPVLLWVVMITSATHRRWTGDVPISDAIATGLSAASIVRTAKLATIDVTEADHLGTLPTADRASVQRHITNRLAAMAAKRD